MKQTLIVCLVLFMFGCSQKKEMLSLKLIPVKQGEYWGYVDKDGKFVVNPQFKRAWTFAEGLALVENTEGKYGFIDEQGKLVISPIYKSALSFSEGLAPVVKDSEKIQYIDPSGKTALTLEEDIERAQGFHDGLALVEAGGKLLFIDKTGLRKFNCPFEDVNQFYDGLALISMKMKDSNKQGFIDKDGKIVINPQFDLASPFIEGIAAVKMDKKFGFIDKTGKIIINPQFDEVQIFGEGMAGVKQGELWGFIDKSGKFTINPQYKQVYPFTASGLAAVKSISNDKWGFIDREGKIKIEPQFERVTPFYDGVAVSTADKKYGLINTLGKYLVNPTFEDYEMEKETYSFDMKGVFSDFFSMSAVTNLLFKDWNTADFRGISKTTDYNKLQDKFPELTHTNYSGLYSFTKERNASLSLSSIHFNFANGFEQTAANGSKTYNDYLPLKTVTYYFYLEGKARDRSGEIMKALKDKWPSRFTTEPSDSNTYILNSSEYSVGIKQEGNLISLIVAFEKSALDFLRPLKIISTDTNDLFLTPDSAAKN